MGRGAAGQEGRDGAAAAGGREEGVPRYGPGRLDDQRKGAIYCDAT